MAIALGYTHWSTPAADTADTVRDQSVRFSGYSGDGLIARSREILPRPFDPMPRPARQDSLASARDALSGSCLEGLPDSESASCGHGRNAAQAAQDDVDRGLAIAGRVLSTDGTAIPGVTLIATPIIASDSDGQRFARDRARYRTVSGANGSYSFAGLPNGNYTIRSNRHDDYPSVRISVHAGIEQADIVLSRE